MKVLLVSLVCLVARVCGGAVAWPGAVPVVSPGYSFRTISPAHTKGFAYSSTQYINALPSAYSFGAYPQFGYPLSQHSAFAPPQQVYYPAHGASYFPSSIYYPSASPIATFTPSSPITPISGISFQPAQPSQPAPPSFPETSSPDSSSQPGDSDSTVIDSAESTPQQSPISEPSNQAQIPSSFPSTFPSFPQIPQDFPSFPQFPQGSGGTPSFPQIPQLPQIPSIPGFPQSPTNPSQNPTAAPPSSFPSVGNQDQGFNDEDSISVESA